VKPKFTYNVDGKIAKEENWRPNQRRGKINVYITIYSIYIRTDIEQDTQVVRFDDGN